MNWKLAFAGALAAALIATAQQAFAEDVVIKVWSRADRSGPLRAGNIVSAGDTLNKMLAAINSDKRVKIELNETNAKGYDDDALDLLKAFAVDKGPDIFVLAHEWTGAFAEAGYALNLEDHITKNPELYGDIIPQLWQAVTYKGARYGVPQDSEVRMFFLNNDKLRKLGKTDKDIAALPAKVDAGEFTMNDLCDLAGQAAERRGQIRDPASAQRRARLPDADRGVRRPALRQAVGQAADVEGGAAQLLHVGQVLRRQEGAFREQHVDVLGRDRAGVVRQRGGAGVLPRRLARHRPDEGVPKP